MITVEVIRNLGDAEIDGDVFSAATIEEAKIIFKRELANLSTTVKHPKVSDKNGIVQVRTNRGRLIGEIIVNK